jgi:serine protease Do
MKSAAGALLLAAATLSQAEIDRGTELRLARSVVRIEAKVPGRYAMGSAVIIGADTLVTSCHVTRRAQAIDVLRGGLRYPVRAQRADIEHDLCVLHAPGIEGTAVELGSSAALARGQEVLAIGYTGGFGQQRSQGRVVSLYTLDRARVIRSDNAFGSGASGGGLFDAQGRLIGVLTFRLRGGQEHYYSAPADWLRSLLDAPEQEDPPVAPLAGQTFWERQPPVQPLFLRASALLQSRDWRALLPVAARWADEDVDDSEPQRLLGLAYEQLGRLGPALLSFERAVAIDTRDASAWFQLGALLHRLGRNEDAQRALDALRPLDDELARRLAARLPNS